MSWREDWHGWVVVAIAWVCVGVGLILITGGCVGQKKLLEVRKEAYIVGRYHEAVECSNSIGKLYLFMFGPLEEKDALKDKDHK